MLCRQSPEESSAGKLQEEGKAWFGQLKIEQEATEVTEGFGELFESEGLAVGAGKHHSLHTIDQFFGQVVPAEEILACWRPDTVQVRAAS